MSKRSLISKTLSGLKWSYLATIVQALVSLLILMILSRLLSPSDFGLLAIALIYMSMAEIVSKMGIGPAIAQRLDLTFRHTEVAFTLSVMLGASVTAATWLFAPLVGLIFKEPAMVEVLRGLSVVFVISGAGNVSEYLLYRELRFKSLTTTKILSHVVGYGFTSIAMAFLGFGIWSLVWGTIARHTIYSLMVIRYSPPPLRPRLAVQEATDLIGYGVGFSFTWFLNSVAQQIGPFVIGRFMGVTSLGYYTRAHSLILFPLQLGFVLIHILFPVISKRQQHKEILRIVYLHGIEMLWLMGLPVSILVFMSAPEIVAVVLGEQWDPVTPILSILAPVVLFATCGIISTPLVRGLGAIYGEAKRQAVFVLFMAVGTWLGSRWGLSGVVTAITVAWLVVYLLMTQLALSLLGLSWRSLIRLHLPALWAGGWVALVLWVTVHQLRSISLPAVVLLIVEFLIWIATVAIAMHFAPSSARPLFPGWVIRNVPFNSMGKTGVYLQNGLMWLGRR